MSQPNQFTKAREAGEVPPQSQNQFTTGKRDKHDPATRDRMRAEKAAAKLEEIVESENSTIDQQIAAGKALIPYGKSTYAAITEHQENDLDSMSKEETLALIRALLSSSPELAAALGIKPQLVSPSDAVPAAHNTHDICTKAA